ncbi:MAG: glycosyltransferase family 2 protein [Lachnospiraceae bacterium]|jgi:glycosyltransferase involved in cell wall biosynthesis|nr:glycosyltransferase family 2 protein [Lachnospiraceae bacterium]
MSEKYELTILMPCLNEAETLAACIRKAKTYLQESGVHGEVVVADNGSTDGSQKIAEAEGARVVHVPEKGYGAALIGGCNGALGRYVIMGDADDSYDFLHLAPFVEKLREGYDLVMGNRFKGGIEPGAMPPLHRYLGNPVLSFIARLFFPCKIGDYHCGLRGYNREAILKLGLVTTGMEYASEMVVKATLNHLRIAEVPTTLKKDGRSHAPHLRSWSDGWRHLKFLLMHSPNWLFMYPGLILFFLGLAFTVILCFGSIKIGPVGLGVHTMMYAAAALMVGANLVMFSLFVRSYASVTGFIPTEGKLDRWLDGTSTERGVVIGLIMCLLGVGATIVAFCLWGKAGFGGLSPESMMRITIPAMLFIVVGIEMVFGSFFIGILHIKHK